MIIELDIWMATVIILNLGVAVIAVSTFRYLLGLLAGVNTTHELSQKDNYAFGLVFAGGATALGLVLSAAVQGEAEVSYMSEVINILTYTAAGIVLLTIGAYINDLLIFYKVPLRKEVGKENISAGIVQAANLVALGLIINTAVNWIETENWEGILSVVLVFFAAQFVLLAVTRIRVMTYSRRHNGESLQKAIIAGNPALAIRYAGHILGSALAITSANFLVEYIQHDPFGSALSWGLVSIAMAIILSLLAFLSRHIILFKINVVEEVDEQQNVGIALIEAAIFVISGLLVGSVLA